jgi:hypothetical protein
LPPNEFTVVNAMLSPLIVLAPSEEDLLAPWVAEIEP